MNWLHHDHQNFEAAVYTCRTACDQANWTSVKRAFSELSSSYQHHVRIEEDVLFASYEARQDVSSAPIKSLMADHTQILNLLNVIGHHLEQNAYNTLAEDCSLLYRTMRRHHEKEEDIFLPMASDILQTDKSALLSKLKNHTARQK